MITTYNSSATLGSALDSLLALREDERPVDITVVDNASSDESREVAAGKPGVTLIANPFNMGLAGANNRGAAMAKGENLFFLNPDVTVLPGAVTALADFSASHPSAALLGPAMTSGSGVLQSTARTWPSLASVAARRTAFGRTRAGRNLVGTHLNRFHTARPEMVHWLVGAALWLSPGGRSTVGLMNEAYFLYFEDVEWCWRAWKAGMEVWFVPDAVILHECRRQSADGAGSAALHHFRSMLRFYSTHPAAALGRGPGRK